MLSRYGNVASMTPGYQPRRPPLHPGRMNATLYWVDVRLTWTPETDPGRMKVFTRPDRKSIIRYNRHIGEQIIHKLKSAEQLIAQGKTVADVCRIIEVRRTQGPRSYWRRRSWKRRYSRILPGETSEPGASPQSCRGSARALPNF